MVIGKARLMYFGAGLFPKREGSAPYILVEQQQQLSPARHVNLRHL